MNFNKFLTKINVRVERTFGLTPMNYRNNGLICRMPRIKHSFEHKSEPNFWSNSLFLNHKRNLFDGKRCSTIATSTRSFTEMRGSGDKGIPEDTPRNRPLMTFKPILFPNLWYKWKNFISINTIIRPFFDNEFTINQFMFGAKQVSHRSLWPTYRLRSPTSRLWSGYLIVWPTETSRLSKDWSPKRCWIADRVDRIRFSIVITRFLSQALNEIQSNYYLMNSRQRTELRVNFDDIMLSFAYRIGIIMNGIDHWMGFNRINRVSFTKCRFRRQQTMGWDNCRLLLSVQIQEFGPNKTDVFGWVQTTVQQRYYHLQLQVRPD